MTIDLREEIADFRGYTSRLVAEHIAARKPKVTVAHFGFTFTQDGWIFVYLDSRPNATSDGEWTKHIEPETILHRPHWYEAAELSDPRNLRMIGVDGKDVAEWSANPNGQMLVNIFGDFIRSSVATFIEEGILRPLVLTDRLVFFIEEFDGLYEWPIDPERIKFIESLREKIKRESGLGL